MSGLTVVPKHAKLTPNKCGNVDRHCHSALVDYYDMQQHGSKAFQPAENQARLKRSSSRQIHTSLAAQNQIQKLS